MPGSARGLVLGYLLDLCLGDPRRNHPVALFGAAALAAERRMYADARGRGALHWAACVAVPVGVVAVGTRALRLVLPAPDASARRGGLRVLGTAVVAWAVVGQRSLVREGGALADALEQERIDDARRQLPALCGRDPSVLDRAALARAGVESLAENTSDAVVAPLLCGALFGVPGLVGYRAVNTLDAMVGNRSQRHANFGWAAARADDLANLLPARLTAMLTCLAAPLVGGRSADAWRTWRRDGHRHPSPNAGHCEAAAAGALGVRLGGPVTYPSGTEVRPVLGDGPPAVPGDVRRAARLSAAVGALALVASAGLATVLGRQR
ncbi:MAG: cobalamin biosynthesis protein [Actinomycetota bacterium]|nr:cobalamin biosynthesis protein [Actinomycetota bacterium]